MLVYKLEIEEYEPPEDNKAAFQTEAGIIKISRAKSKLDCRL
jgi:hypothetical protein